jgi:hypothetical protein
MSSANPDRNVQMIEGEFVSEPPEYEVKPPSIPIPVQPSFNDLDLRVLAGFPKKNNTEVSQKDASDDDGNDDEVIGVEESKTKLPIYKTSAFKMVTIGGLLLAFVAIVSNLVIPSEESPQVVITPSPEAEKPKVLFEPDPRMGVLTSKVAIQDQKNAIAAAQVQQQQAANNKVATTIATQPVSAATPQPAPIATPQPAPIATPQPTTQPTTQSAPPQVITNNEPPQPMPVYRPPVDKPIYRKDKTNHRKPRINSEPVTSPAPARIITRSQPVISQPQARIIARSQPVTPPASTRIITRSQPVISQPQARIIARSQPVTPPATARIITRSQPVISQSPARIITRNQPITPQSPAKIITRSQPITPQSPAKIITRSQPVTPPAPARIITRSQPVISQPQAKIITRSQPVTPPAPARIITESQSTTPQLTEVASWEVASKNAVAVWGGGSRLSMAQQQQVNSNPNPNLNSNNPSSGSLQSEPINAQDRTVALVGQQLRAKTIVPYQVANNSTEPQSIVLALSEPLVNSRGNIMFPAGTQIITEIATLDNGLMQVTNAKIYYEGQTIDVPKQALILQNNNKQPLIAQSQDFGNGDIANRDLRMFGLGALQGIGQNIIQPKTQTIIANGGTIQTSEPEVSYVGAALNGGLTPVLNQMAARNQAANAQSSNISKLWILPTGTEVNLVVAQPFSF